MSANPEVPSASKKIAPPQSAKVTVNPASAMSAVNAKEVPVLSVRFEVEKLLGEGGMGRVFAAHDRGLGRTVAVKELRQGFEHDEDALRRFLSEAQIGAQLAHPNILPLYSVERAESGAPAFAMQLVEGRTLADYAEEAAKLPRADREGATAFCLKERLTILLGACEAVHFAHRRGVIHRDLKPENIMLGHHREVYLMDWGLARVMEQEAAAQGTSAPPVVLSDQEKQQLESAATVLPQSGNGAMPTQQGQVMGTAQYMAPEQARGDLAQMGPAADQFALGIVLAELATLHPARSWTSFGEALIQAVAGEVAVGRDVDGELIDPALVAVIARATALRPEARYPSVEAFAEDLRRFVRGETVNVYREPVAKRLVRAAARRPALSVGILAAGLLAFAGFEIANLLQAKKAAVQHAYDLEETKRILVAVGDRTRAIDVWFSDVASGLGALGAATEEILARPPNPNVKLPLAYTGLKFSPRHGADVSYLRPGVSWIGRASGKPQSNAAVQLDSISLWLTDAISGGLPADELRLDLQARRAAVATGHSTFLRSYVGVESDGSFVQYPARELPPGYDPRNRPWYRAAKATDAQQWTRPMLSLGGTTLRIASVLPLQSKGKFEGAAGVDLLVSEIASQLKIAGARRAYLVMPDGRIAVRDDLEKRFVGSGAEPDGELDLPKVENAGLAEKIAAGDPGGILTIDGVRLVYARMVSPPWTYVAEIPVAKEENL